MNNEAKYRLSLTNKVAPILFADFKRYSKRNEFYQLIGMRDRNGKDEWFGYIKGRSAN